MAEKQLTSEELQQVKGLQEQTQQVTMQLGNLEIKKMQLKNLISQLQQQEEQIAKTLSDKYGNGTLDIDTGKLTIV
tara:strand:- start:453 stop:680 length:228 start_codon:yes stop_codon:yes gene_type:complete